MWSRGPFAKSSSKSFASRTKARRFSGRGNNRPAGGPRRLQMEPLEERAMLAIVFPSSSDGDATAMVEGLNADVREYVPGLIDATLNNLPGTADPAWVYQAFPGEINDINVYGGMLDSFLFLNDTDSVPIYRILPAVSKDVYGVEYSAQYDLSIEFALTVEAVVELFAEAKSAPASWFEAGVHAGASVGFGVTAAFSPGWTWGQMFSPLDQMFDMADARAVLPN